MEYRDFMLTNKYKHAEHGNLAPVLWLLITAILTYTGWNLREDWCGMMGCDDEDDDGGFGPIPIDIGGGGSYLLLAVAAVAAFALARRG